MALPPCSTKEAGSEEVSSTPQSQRGSARQRWSQNFPPWVLTVGGRPALPSSTKTARRLPSGPAWGGSPHPDPVGWCPGWGVGGSLHTRPFTDPESSAKRTIYSTSLLTGGELPGPGLTMRLLNSFVTRKAMSQLVRTQTPVATPLTCRGKISDMRSQGMGPQPTAKPREQDRCQHHRDQNPRSPADPGADAWRGFPHGLRGLGARLGSPSAPSRCEIGQALCFLHSG